MGQVGREKAGTLWEEAVQNPTGNSTRLNTERGRWTCEVLSSIPSIPTPKEKAEQRRGKVQRIVERNSSSQNWESTTVTDG
jgi:hypothetical protein